MDLPVVDRVVLSTQDDWFDDAVVHFGEPPAVALRAGKGHPILWVAGPPGIKISGEDLARGMAEGRPVVRYQLRWECLV